MEQNGNLPVPVSRLGQMLAEARTVPDLLDVRDVAQRIRDALRVHGRGSKEELVEAAACAIRTERRLGELLLGMEKRPAGRPPRNRSHDGTDLPPRLLDLGLTKNDSSRWQAIARIPNLEFEEHVASHVERVKEATTAFFLRLARSYEEDDPEGEEGEAPESNGESPEEEPPEMPRGLVLGNCLDLLPTFPAESADLVLTDPPYNNGTNYGDGPGADRLPDDIFLAGLRHSMAECSRILKPNGTLWVVMADEYADHLGLILRGCGFHRRAWVKWYETFGVCNSAMNNFSRCSRHLFYCVKDPKRFTFDFRAVNRSSARQDKYADKRANPGGKVWDDVWMIRRVMGTSKERVIGFPTQLPLELVEPIILACSRKGGLVLDPYAGSATSGVAALRHGREYLGIEIVKRFYTRAARRLDKESRRQSR